MMASAGALAAQTGPFVAGAALSGLRAPLRIAELDTRAWPLLDRAPETFILDEFGDLWWARIEGSDARVVRAPWPEEIASLRGEVARALARLRARASHPAGRGRVDGGAAPA